MKLLIQCGTQCVRRICASAVRRELIAPIAALENSTLSVSLKQRPHKKRAIAQAAEREGKLVVLAYATANSYDLAKLRAALLQQNLYESGRLAPLDAPDVVHASAKYKLGEEPREIFFFREGAAVFWNCSELEANNVLSLLSNFEEERYPDRVVQREKEIMTYTYQSTAKKCCLHDSQFVLVEGQSNVLEKYTFSNALAQSAKLGAWEASLETLATSIRALSTDMEKGRAPHLSKRETVKRLGELFSLRHHINVESDLLDTPDFYWEQEELEKLYSSTVSYLCVARRTRVLNERLTHCVELLELLSGWLADRHHVRLEWMIIALIMIEVCFELLHFLERYQPHLTSEPVAFDESRDSRALDL